MAYEILLDDFLAKLSKKGIDISKLTIEEESTTDRLNITKEFVYPIKCSIDNFSKNNQRLFTYNQIIKNTPQTWGVFYYLIIC